MRLAESCVPVARRKREEAYAITNAALNSLENLQFTENKQKCTSAIF